MLGKQLRKNLTVLAMVVASGCATMPTGPSVLVLPSRGKPIERFQAEDVACRQWAAQQTGISAQDTADRSAVRSAVVGTAVGTGVGALLGAASGNAGQGAAIGAGSGLLIGTVSGADASMAYGWEAQQRYDYAYVQCMYSKGNQIPDRVHRYRLRRVPAPPAPSRYSVPPDYVPDD